MQSDRIGPILPGGPVDGCFMRLTNLADHAVVVMRAASRHCGQRLAGQAPVRMTATTLARETGLPLPTVQKLVSVLTRAGLMVGARGTGGGVRLARPPAAITLADIIEAVEGPIAMTQCAGPRDQPDAQPCRIEADCQLKPHWGAVNAQVRGVFSQVTLASLAAEFA